jgi:dihydrofolate reductase
LDGCVDHRAGSTDEELHRFWTEKLAQADALLFGRVTYEMMQAAWRSAATGTRPEWMADWMEPFACTIDAAKKYVVSNTLPPEQVDWNEELVRVRGGDDLAKAVQRFKQESGGAGPPDRGLFVGGVKLPLALAELGLIDDTSSWCTPELPAMGQRCSRGCRSIST